MFTFKEPFDNPIDQFTWARALLTFLSESIDGNPEGLELSKDAAIGQSAIIDTACDIIKDVISILPKQKWGN